MNDLSPGSRFGIEIINEIVTEIVIAVVTAFATQLEIEFVTGRSGWNPLRGGTQ